MGKQHSPRRAGASQQLLGIVALMLAGGAVAGVIYWQSRPPVSAEPEPPPSRIEQRFDPPSVTGPVWFQDMTAGSGIDFTYRNDEEAGQFTILETLGGGVALLDYDGDGRLDLFATGGGYYDGPAKNELKGYPCKLYRNRGNWKFEDVTEKVGLTGPWWYTHGAAVADYNRDGWPDLLVTGYGKVALFRNEPSAAGGRKFVDVTASVGLKDDSWATSAGWGDLDGDGFPDLYICHYCDWSFTKNPKCYSPGDSTKRDTCAPSEFKPLVHALFHNQGGNAFKNVSAEQGFRALGRGLGVVLADVNDDGKPDVYVGNDMSYNFLFFNRSGKLEEKAVYAGVAVNERGLPDGSMGVDVGDYDGTGRASLWVTNYQGELHALSRNLGGETFHYQSRPAGIAAIGQLWVGFGTGFIDVDCDGWEDLVIAHGHVLRHPPLGSPYRQRPVLLHNEARDGRRFFRDVSLQGGPFFQTPSLGRGVAIGDLDNDGRPDLVFSHTNSPLALLRNLFGDSAPTPWIGVKLVGKGKRDVVGSKVIVETATRKLTRFVKGGGSYLSAHDPRLLFGLGEQGTAKSVTVMWSWGQSQTWDGLEPNAYWELREGESKPIRIDYPK